MDTWQMRLRKALRGRLRAFLRRAPAASGYLATGVLIGIGASQLWDLPARLPLLADGLFGPTEPDLEWAVSEGTVTPSSLPGFDGLQQEVPPVPDPGPEVPTSRAPEPRATLPTVAAPAPVPASVPADPPAAREGKAAQLVSEIASRVDGARGPGARTGTVVQVASYTDARSADALVVRLRRKGFDSFVMQSEDDTQARFRVRVQPRGEISGSVLAEQLGELGFSVWITQQ